MEPFVKKHELWRSDYRQERYMEYLSQADLDIRFSDIINNSITLTEKGQLGLHQINEAGRFWLIKWTHLLEEFSLRHGSYPSGLPDGKGVSIVNSTYPESPLSKSAIDTIGGVRPGNIYKFGKYEHLSTMFQKGVIRISPASYYADPSLNKAIQDDELSLSLSNRADNLTIKTELGAKVAAFGNVQFQLKSPTNYYVHCFAAKYTFREFDDFEADACIIIKKPRKLFQKMMRMVRDVKPNYSGFSTPVHYIDPLTSNPKDINIFFSKHFRYSYQNEVRTIWLPDKPVNKLEPFFINIGEMGSYAEIVRIK